MSKSKFALIGSSKFSNHVTPPGHPERIERAEVMDAVARHWEEAGHELIVPRLASENELKAVHTDDHVKSIASTAGRAVGLDPDTYTSPDSYEVARLAAGAAIMAVGHTLDNNGSALALVRPPGHHAERDRAMGFCLFNSVAVAAASALARGLSRVAVVDYDVHHGNGTQWMFYDDPRVLYVSTHQHPFYPGTGKTDDVGQNQGEGFTFNVPLAAGANDADYDLVFRSLITPVLRSFSPELLIVSAGYDAHERDPLAGMRVTTQGYAAMTRHLLAVAAECCQGRLAAVVEGGYDLQALTECLESTIQILDQVPSGQIPTFDGIPERADAVIDSIRRVQRPYWSTL